jgi:PAS domain-containing protein
LSDSECELWRVDLGTNRLFRESVLRSLGPQLPNGTPVQAFRELVHPEDRDEFLRASQSCVSGATPNFQAVYRCLGIDGKYHWLQSRGRMLVERGKPAFLSGTSIDISPLKAREDELQRLNGELENQLTQLQAARAAIDAIETRRKLALWGSGCEFFECDLAAGVLRRENHLHGLAANQMGEQLSLYWQYLHPDDRQEFIDGFVRHVKGETDFYDVTYRARTDHDTWVWIQTRGRAVDRDANGQATMIAGTNYEVTGLKQQEMELIALDRARKSRRTAHC